MMMDIISSAIGAIGAAVGLFTLTFLYISGRFPDGIMEVDEAMRYKFLPFDPASRDGEKKPVERQPDYFL